MRYLASSSHNVGTEDAAAGVVGDDGVAGDARPSAAGTSLTGGRQGGAVSSKDEGGETTAAPAYPAPQHLLDLAGLGLSPTGALEALSHALSSALDAAAADTDVSPKERRRRAALAAGIAEIARAAQARLKSAPPVA